MLARSMLSPAGDNTTKSSMERIDPLSADTNSNWATNDGQFRNGLDANGNPINGTPRERNSTTQIDILEKTATPEAIPTSTSIHSTATSSWTPTATATFTATPSGTSSPTPTATSTHRSFAVRSVIISEIAWAGTFASSNDEWIELYNTTTQNIDLTHWQLTTNDGTPTISLTGTIGSHGFILLERSDDDTVQDITADLLYVGALANSGERLVLLDPQGNVIDVANNEEGSWPAGDEANRASMERVYFTSQDAANHWVTNNEISRNGIDAAGNPINGTPRQVNRSITQLTNTPTPSPTEGLTPQASPTHTPSSTHSPTTTSTPSPTVTPTAAMPGSILINEVSTDPQQDWNDSEGGNAVPFDDMAGSGTIGTTDEWIELLNAGLEVINLSTWALHMIDTTPATLFFADPGATLLRFSNGGTVNNFQPGEYLTIGNPPGSMNNDVFLVLRDQVASSNSVQITVLTDQRAIQDVFEHVIDDLEIGFDPEGDGDDGAPAPGENGNATGLHDEVIARIALSVGQGDDIANFTKQAASIGRRNEGLPATYTPVPTISSTPTSTRTPSATPSPTTTPINPGAIILNEVVPDPKHDWNDSSGGDGIAFNNVPGSGNISSSDEWVELKNATPFIINLVGWSVIMNDSSTATLTFGPETPNLRFSKGGSVTAFQPGEYLTIGNPPGTLNNVVFIQLVDATGVIVDDVEIGDDLETDGPDGAPGPGRNGNSVTVYDESIARMPDSQDLNIDRNDFAKGPATIGAPNGTPRLDRFVQLPTLYDEVNSSECTPYISIQNIGRRNGLVLVCR